MSQISMQNKAMLVGLAIRGWQARKYDKKISLEVIEKHTTTADAGRFNKHLLPGSAESYENVHKKGRELRAFYYEQTLPWSKDGQRILPTANYEKFAEGARKFKHEYAMATEAFLRDYPVLKEDAKVLLSSMFNELDYPSLSDMRFKFGIDLEVLPMPCASDFRVSLADAEVERIKREIETRMEAEIATAQKDLWNRLHNAVDNMILRLGKPEGKFHDTLVSNVADLVDLIPRLNLTGDPKLEEVRAKCEETLTAHTPQELRDDTIIRGRVAAQAREISSLMDAYM